MDEALAYSTLAFTVALAVSRPRVGLRQLRVTPGSAALLGVLVLLATGLLRVDDMVASARIQWRPLLSLACIMTMTGVVQETGAFERLAQRLEAHVRGRPASVAFSLVFVLSVLTPSLLNNDAAILLLTPLVVPLSRRLYPGRAAVTEALAFAVFLAPGVAPLVTSNPMNMIVAEFAGLGFNAYAAVMIPVSAVGAVLTYLVLRLAYRRELTAPAAPAAPGGDVRPLPAHPGERPALLLLLAVFGAYPVAATLGAPIWTVTVAGALAALAISHRFRVAPIGKALAHVSPDILLFLWGVFLVVVGLRHVGVVERLAALYQAAPAGSARELGTIGVVAALGSAIVDNHPMSILDMMALGTARGARPLLAALVGGDIGPRLLPIGSLAGLLWMDLLRRQGVEIPIGRFVRLGTLVLLPTLTVSLLVLWLTGP